MSENGWRSIDSAPKDGTSVLAYAPLGNGGYRIITMCWSGKGEGCWRVDIHSFVRFDPTHWQPIPDPPVSESPPE